MKTVVEPFKRGTVGGGEMWLRDTEVNVDALVKQQC